MWCAGVRHLTKGSRVPRNAVAKGSCADFYRWLRLRKNRSPLRHHRRGGREAAFDAAELRVKHIDEAAAAISTRSVDALFKAMGAAGMSKSRASCLGAEIDERLSLETLTRLTDIVHVKSPTVAT